MPSGAKSSYTVIKFLTSFKLTQRRADKKSFNSVVFTINIHNIKFLTRHKQQLGKTPF